MKTALILFSAMLISNLAFGMVENDGPKFYSRNMPATCEYVFSVESDLRLELPLALDEEEIFYQLKNSWAPYELTEARGLTVKISGNIRLAELTLVSMSIPEKYLYRDILLHFPKANVTCKAEFGRQFGEACFPGGRSATPWKVRTLTCEVQQ